MAPPVLKDRDWSAYNHNLLSQREVDEISDAFSAYFLTRTMAELYQAACDRRLMLCPGEARKARFSRVANSRRASSSTRSAVCGGLRVPRSFAAAEGLGVRERLPGASNESSESSDFRSVKLNADAVRDGGRGIFSGLKVVEFGAGAAAPLATRYFADQGATVVKVESRRRPDFLRTLRDDGTGSLDSSLFFACINPNKRSVGLNMKDPRGVDTARRLIGWADVVVENFAPGGHGEMGDRLPKCGDRQPLGW